jgi:hypothetical protein
MNADDGTEEPGNEENDNPDVDCDFDEADENEGVSEGEHSSLYPGYIFVIVQFLTENSILDCFDTQTPRADNYNTDKDSLHVNQQSNGKQTRPDQVSLNVIEHTGDCESNDATPEGNVEHDRIPVTGGGNDGHGEDSVLSSGCESRDKGVIAQAGSPEGPLAVSSPGASARDNDSGVYTAEDLFRDMLAKRGKGTTRTYS